MGKLDGKIALVTGGTSGIGLGTAQHFVDEGAYVFVMGRRKPELDAAVAKIGKNVTGIQADASKLPDLDALYAAIKAAQGRLDILFVNAGGGEFAPLGSITEEHYNKTFDTNVKGLLFTVQKALPLLADGASIILNASIVSIKAMPAFSVYSASKAAVRSFARGWSIDLKERKIRVNVVSPGVVVTPAYTALGMENVDKDPQMLAQIPLGRTGTPLDIAKAVAFLASEDSAWITGVELFVDGGMAQI
jgi:NAD(P)-dependent dehydrogenase (short-subunit alcohol dehydrogenase family)